MTVLNNAFVGASAIAGGVGAGEGRLGYVICIVEAISAFAVPFIGAGFLALKQYDKQKTRKEAFALATKFGSVINGDVSQFAKVAELIAWGIINNEYYAQEIDNLDDKDVE